MAYKFIKKCIITDYLCTKVLNCVELCDIIVKTEPYTNSKDVRGADNYHGRHCIKQIVNKRRFMNHARNGLNTREANRKQMHEIIIEDGTHDVSSVVQRLLTILGFKSKLIGTQYLMDAILYRYDNCYNLYVGMTNGAYTAVANMRNTTSTRVERAIRNTIVNCHTHGALSSFNVLTHTSIIDDQYAPSNGEFMCSVVNWLQLEKKSGHIMEKDSNPLESRP